MMNILIFVWLNVKYIEKFLLLKIFQFTTKRFTILICFYLCFFLLHYIKDYQKADKSGFENSEDWGDTERYTDGKQSQYEKRQFNF